MWNSVTQNFVFHPFLNSNTNFVGYKNTKVDSKSLFYNLRQYQVLEFRVFNINNVPKGK